ncbi:KICSTOR complex protein kaptin-like [Lytechinus pictus]|uniref:KICSTOR complex protein kaptin-like n=1 Tax=Lytechinus pictus TaxID=7653 RepID=UPI0030BA1A62
MAERHGFHEAHFTSIPCQSNVYGLTSLAYPGGVGKVLVAPLKDKVVSLEYMAERGKTELQPVAKEIHFAGIPDDAEIISIDSYQRLMEDGGGYIIGITFAKDAETDHPSHILNLYAPWDKGSEYVLDSIAQMWTNIELDFTPYYLCHTKILEDGEQEIVFLLTGSDNQVHLYREELGGRFSEHPVTSIFPEFNDLPCVALWLDSWNLKDCRRLSVVGCRSGYIRLVLVNTRNNEVMNQWELNHDSAITCSRIFTSSTHMESALPWLERREEGIQEKEEEDDTVDDTILDDDLNILITSAVEVAVVYRNVLKEGFQNQTLLPQSDLFDCALCTCVADLDWDGQNELLIGTYGQALLAYKYISPESANIPSTNEQAKSDNSLPDEKPTNDEDGEGGGGGGGGGRRNGHYELLWSRSFAHPLLALNHFDLTGDGLKEVIVLSTRGLHVLQHNLDKAAQRCLETLKELNGDDPT